jgi:TPR repeat protein
MHLIKLLVCVLLLIYSVAQAAEMDACYQANFKQIDRVTDLPTDVIGLIYANNQGERNLSALPKDEQNLIQSGKAYLGISDRGGPFSPGCSPVGNEASLRLIMAAASDECILVAIEHGGAGHGAGLRVFLREGDAWIRGDKFEHPSAYLMYQGKYDTDLPTFVVQANYELGGAFRHGQGVNKDLVESLKWYSLAANQGNAKAQFSLGNIYAEGLGTEKSFKTAISWFEKAATTNAEFEYRLGKIYIEGKLLPQDIKLGLQKVKSAVAHENSNAQVYMGELYLSGTHIKQNYAEAIKLFRKSVNLDGRYQLANLYKDGIGVERNSVAAWALLSGVGGYAYQELPQLEKVMSQSDIQQAKLLKNEMDGYFTSQGSSSYVQPKGVLTALDSYLERQ